MCVLLYKLSNVFRDFRSLTFHVAGLCFGITLRQQTKLSVKQYHMYVNALHRYDKRLAKSIDLELSKRDHGFKPDFHETNGTLINTRMC